MSDAINPSHYKSRVVEAIDLMRAAYGDTAIISHCECTALKYRLRAGLKEGQPPEQDIAKALWYEAFARHLRGLGPDPREVAK